MAEVARENQSVVSCDLSFSDMVELKGTIDKQAMEAMLCPSQCNVQGKGMCLPVAYCWWYKF